MEASRQFDVVSLATGPVAHGFKLEPRHTRSHALGAENAALDLQSDSALAGGAGDRLESLFHRRLGSGVERKMIDPFLLQHPQPVVDTAVQVNQVERALEQFDRRQELPALQAV